MAIGAHVAVGGTVTGTGAGGGLLLQIAFGAVTMTRSMVVPESTGQAAGKD